MAKRDGNGTSELFQWEVMEYVYYGPTERHKPGRKRVQGNFRRKGDRFWATEEEVEPEKWKVRKIRTEIREPAPPPPPPRRRPISPRRVIETEDTMLHEPPQASAADD